MLSEETKQELESKHGDRLYYLSAGGHEFAVLSPTAERVERFISMASSAEKKHLAAQTLFRDCCVAPATAELRRIFDLKPFYEIKLGGKIAELGGSDDEIAVKKALP